MIMKKVFSILAVTAALTLSSCAVVSYSNTATTAKSQKVGVAKKRVWFGLAFNVDVSAATAARNGGISKIATVDFAVRRGPFSTSYITRVTGE